jgi:DNA-directed RNA polymerase subunit RPC12/RpoP
MPVREDIFWVTCPQCEEKFYCENELRHGTIKLMCPKCHHRFLASESPKIVG